MTSKRLGRQTVRLGSPVSVLSYANIGGKQEAQGPLAGYFDELNQDYGGPWRRGDLYRRTWTMCWQGIC